MISPPDKPLAGTLTPSSSLSSGRTTYPKTSFAVPLPVSYAAFRVAAPTARATTGVPVTNTSSSKVISSWMVSPTRYCPPWGANRTSTMPATSVSTLNGKLVSTASSPRSARLPAASAMMPSSMASTSIVPSASASPDSTV